MSETKFTPGPWHGTHPAMGFSSLYAGHRLVFALAHPSTAHGDDDISDEEKYANLTLLESAPDLYAAVEAARVYVACAYECAFPNQNENDAVLAEIDAALARARGEA